MDNTDKKILLSPKDCETLEDYYEYKRQCSREWYKKNRDYKIAYQREYYRKKKLEDAKISVNEEKTLEA